MMKVIQHVSPLCGMLMLAACSNPAPQADDAAAASAAGMVRSADGRYAVGDRLSPEPAADEAPGQRARTLIWDDLIPPDYDPAVIFDDIDLDALADNDPRADQLLADLGGVVNRARRGGVGWPIHPHSRFRGASGG